MSGVSIGANSSGDEEGAIHVRIVIVGDEAVGKTALLGRWTCGSFDPNPQATIGAAYVGRRDRVDDCDVCFCYWDTAGAERYRSLAPICLRDAQSVLVCFDLSVAQSFESVGRWVEFVRGAVQAPILVVGCKSDLVSKERSVDGILEVRAQQWAEKEDCEYWETSARTGEGVSALFYQVETRAWSEWRQASGFAVSRVGAEAEEPRKCQC